MTYGPAPVFDEAACGTDKQYRKHLRHGIPPCEACKQAERFRQWKQRSPRQDEINANARRRHAANADAINRRRRERRKAGLA